MTYKHLKHGSSVNSLMGVNSSKTSCKDNISIDNADDVAEIMKVKCKIVGKEAKVSYNKILVKADCDVYVMYLTEDNRIGEIKAKLPVMGFVDIQNISEDNICDVKCKLKNIVVKPDMQETRSIYIEAEVEITCFAYETKEIDIIEDLYSLSANLKHKEKKIRTMAGKERVKDMCNIREQMNIPEIGSNKIYNVDVMPSVNTMNLYNGRVVFEGNINLEILYDLNDRMSSKNMELPFTFEMQSQMLDELTTIEPEIEVDRDNFTIISDGNIEADIGLNFDLGVSKNKELSIIDEIDLDETEIQNSYSMVIYFVKQGDTLWDVAKKMKGKMDDIRTVNELENDRITAGQQLYIPKSVARVSA